MSAKTQTQPKENLENRPPIVVVMGHVDHGKSTLLDFIRKANTVEKEAGGITQHIAAYEISHKDEKGQGKKITFVDTPGHISFQEMRSRGANVADIAILVVAADDGVKAQTLEALDAIKQAKIPFIVAVNKIDKPNANPDNAKQQLAEKNVFVEGYGGDIPVVLISAKEGTGIEELLEMILLMAEMENLQTDFGQTPSAVVVESHLDPKIGVVATSIIRSGSPEKGNFVVSEDDLSRLRVLEDFSGKQIDKAKPSQPVRIIGLSTPPPVGSVIKFLEEKKEAEKELQSMKKPTPVPTPAKPSTPEEEGKQKVVVPMVLKADTLGSLEAVEKELAKLQTDRVSFDFLHRGVGDISEGDVKLLVGTKKPLAIGFNVKADGQAKDVSSKMDVEIALFDIIYKLTEWAEEVAAKRKPIITVEKETGKAKVIKIFSKSKDNQLIGGAVTAGSVEDGKEVKILRRETEIGKGKVKELQQQRAKVSSVEEGKQFGAMVNSKTVVAEGDQLIIFELTHE